MTDIQSIQILQSNQQVFDDNFYIFLTDLAFVEQIIESTSFTQFHYYIDIGVSAKAIFVLDKIGTW